MVSCNRSLEQVAKSSGKIEMLIPVKIVASVGAVRATELDVHRSRIVRLPVRRIGATEFPVAVGNPRSSAAIVGIRTITDCSHSGRGRQIIRTLATGDGHCSTRLSLAISGGVEDDPCVFAAVAVGCSCVSEQRESRGDKKSLLEHRGGQK